MKIDTSTHNERISIIEQILIIFTYSINKSLPLKNSFCETTMYRACSIRYVVCRMVHVLLSISNTTSQNYTQHTFLAPLQCKTYHNLVVIFQLTLSSLVVICKYGLYHHQNSRKSMPPKMNYFLLVLGSEHVSLCLRKVISQLIKNFFMSYVKIKRQQQPKYYLQDIKCPLWSSLFLPLMGHVVSRSIEPQSLT